MPIRFGDLLLDEEIITGEQLDEAIEYQKTGKYPLGEVMVKMRLLTREQVQQVLDRMETESGSGKRFGEQAVELGLINGAERDKAVEYQTHSKGMLGEILIFLGYLTEQQRDDLIRKQLTMN